jgi:hypothetical protein
MPALYQLGSQMQLQSITKNGEASSVLSKTHQYFRRIYQLKHTQQLIVRVGTIQPCQEETIVTSILHQRSSSTFERERTEYLRTEFDGHG